MEVKKGYKQTDIGVIPKDWDVKPLSEITREIGDGIHATPEYVPYSDYHFINGNNINNGSVVITENTMCISEAEYRRLRKQLDNKTILMSINGTIGNLAFFRDEKVVLGKSAAYIKLSQGISDKYIYYTLQSFATKTFYDNELTGTTIRNLSLGSIRNTPIPTPKDEAEQHAIAAALSDVDALLNSLDALIAKKRLIKQGAMQELLTGKKRLSGFSGEWEKASIAELEKKGWLKLSRGEVISKKDIDNIPGDYPIYSSSIKNSGLFGKYGKFMFDEELITWSVDGGGNFFYRHKHKFSVTNVSGFMRVDTSIFSYRFLAYELEALHSRLVFDYQTKAHPSVIRKAYDVLVPSLKEQTAIAEILSDMDAEISALEQKREKTRLLKQGMMQELLTGRIRLV